MPPRRWKGRHALTTAGTLLTLLMFHAMAGARVLDTPCKEKCLTDYEEVAATCGKIAAEDVRRTCQDKAYEQYKSCRAKCTEKEGDCLEHCKELCYQIMDKCKEDCKNDPNPRECRSQCSNAYAECLRECDRKCKEH